MAISTSSLRPPAVPLVVHDPYLSVWSTSDRLTDQSTKHWTGKNQSLRAMLRVDGVCYSFISTIRHWEGADAAPMTQASLEVLPTRTIYQFEAAGVHLTLTFITPLLPHDLEILARPVTYIDVQVAAMDGRAHQTELYLEAASNLVVNTTDQQVVWGRHRLGQRDLLWIGSKDQAVLAKTGDDVRIDWGYLYTTALQEVASALGGDRLLHRHFAETGSLPDQDDLDMPRAIDDTKPIAVAAWVFSLGNVTADAVSRQLIIAYDDRFSVEYRYRKLRPYWRRNGSGAADLIAAAIADYPSLKQRCEAFDAELMTDLRASGGEQYAQLAALSFRQCIAAHKLVADLDGTLLWLSKENYSNGCMATVDVAYPSAPLFLLFNPDLLEAQLTPVLDYAASLNWRFPFAPHDIGRYPVANGQVYGGGEETEDDQMPVEECGNMLLLVAALCKARGDASYAQGYWELLRGWADYLVEKGLDPENQLCTDDFAGHVAHNVNLSLKALLAIGAFAQLADKNGLPDQAEQYRTEAEQMAENWLKMAEDGDHYRLVFDQPGSWSQKYNLVWDKLLDLGLFPPELAAKEVAYYKTKQARYGLPLDNRAAYTKLDWIVWSASLSDNQPDFESFIEPLYVWMNETESRVPLPDWYYTDSGRQAGFQARSVVGGVFIKLLYDADLWHKWMSRA